MIDRRRFGKTGLEVSQVAFGGIPIMRLTRTEAVKVVKGVIDLGINFIDTAYGYGDSEEKIGEAVKDIPREKLIIASKSPASDKKTFLSQLDESLKRLGTDYIDIFQHHNIASREKWEAISSAGGAAEGMEEAVQEGKVRFPAFSSHSVDIAIEIMKTGKYYAVQIPFNFVDNQPEKDLIPLAADLDMGVIAMKPLGGGLLSNAHLCFRYLMQYPGIIPDPGIEKLTEMEEIIRILDQRGSLTEDEKREMEKIKEDFSGKWCHRCDYCQPCPQDIPISTILIAESAVKRMPYERAVAWIDPAIEASKNCADCRDCVKRCPYDLEIPELLKEMQRKWEIFKKDRVWPRDEVA